MLANVLSMLLFLTRSNAKSNAPVFYTHSCGGSLYQIIVQRISDKEALAA